jgi:hypothetical protein
VASALASAPFRLPAAPLVTDLVAKYFRGLGDPSRLRILELLRDEGPVFDELAVDEAIECQSRAITCAPTQAPCSRPRSIAARKWIPPYSLEIAASSAAAPNELNERAGSPRASWV